MKYEIKNEVKDKIRDVVSDWMGLNLTEAQVEEILCPLPPRRNRGMGYQRYRDPREDRGLPSSEDRRSFLAYEWGRPERQRCLLRVL
jgi:hypothetical protein